MKIFACLLAACSLSTVALADSHLASPTQRITSFVSGGINPNMSIALQQNARVTLPTYFFSSDDNPQTDGQGRSIDFSAFFNALSADLSDHHLDPVELANLKDILDNFHLDPALAAKLETLFQDLENGRCDKFQVGSAGDDNDESAENDNDEDEHEDLDEGGGPIQVPEPSTLAMFIAGAALLGGTFLRRRVR